MNKMIFALALASTALVATNAQANTVAGPSVGGFSTFTDQNSGRNWLRLDSFFNKSADDMIAAATPAGFTLANQSDVTALLASLPLNGSAAAWDDYRAVMGGAPNRDLIWGAFAGSVSGMVGWAWSYRGESSWSNYDNEDMLANIPNSGTPDADLNLWAYSVGGAVPEPTTWAMMIGGLAIVGISMRRSKAEVSFA